jgi:hypothetical protein
MMVGPPAPTHNILMIEILEASYTGQTGLLIRDSMVRVLSRNLSAETASAWLPQSLQRWGCFFLGLFYRREVPSGMRLEFGLARSPGNMKVSFQAARSIG